MNKYVIRRELNPVAVLALDEICFPHDYRVKLENAHWWIVWYGEDAVGYAGLRPCKASFNTGVGFLCRAGVTAKHRGNGLQKRLIRARENAARTLGLRELVTYVKAYNLSSVNSLVACGYRFYSPAEKWGGSDALYFQKKLTKA